MLIIQTVLGKLEPGKLESVKIWPWVSIIVKNKMDNVDCIMGVFSNTLLVHLTYIREFLTSSIHNNSDKYPFS